jgi:hypothetical protein
LSLTRFVTVVSPVLAMDKENVLTTSLTFTSLFLFAALRFPINYAGKFMGKAAQGFQQACHRFSAFFARESVRDGEAREVAPICEIYPRTDASSSTEGSYNSTR